MDHHAPAPVDPQELHRAQTGWVNFTKFATVGILHVIALLILMAIFLT